jgi:hypothetical protein
MTTMTTETPSGAFLALTLLLLVLVGLPTAYTVVVLFGLNKRSEQADEDKKE